MSTIHLEIVSAERVVYEDDVEILVLQGKEGQMGILPNHAPLLTELEPGELLLRKNDEEVIMSISGGFAEVLDNRVVILADAAERVDEISEQRAQEAVLRAERRLSEKSGDLDLEKAMASIRRAQIRLKVVRRHRPERN